MADNRDTGSPDENKNLKTTFIRYAESDTAVAAKEDNQDFKKRVKKHIKSSAEIASESHDATLRHKRYVLWCVGVLSVAWFVVIVWTLVYLGLPEYKEGLFPTPVLIALIAAGTSTAAVMPTILASAVFSKKKTEIPDTLAKLVKLLKEAGLGDKK